MEPSSSSPKRLCMCFPCILNYLDGYIYPRHKHQHYPALERKGFSAAEQKAIAEEWYWVAIERETAINDYLRGMVTFRDGCWWRPPPRLPSISPTSTRPSVSSISSSVSAPET